MGLRNNFCGLLLLLAVVILLTVNINEVGLGTTMQERGISGPGCTLENNTRGYRFEPLKYDKIYLYHSRKAGGSTMRHYFHQVSKKYNITLEVDEGATCKEPDEERTFYVTHLRKPVERSISHFKYSFRWACKDLMNRDFKPSYQNAVPFMAWLNYSQNCKLPVVRKTRKCWARLWVCAGECYVRWFSSTFETNLTLAYHEAKRKISKFHLVLETEKFNDPHFRSLVEDFFNVPNFVHSDAYCASESRKANHMNPLNISSEELDILTKKNYWDTKFYDDVFRC